MVQLWQSATDDQVALIGCAVTLIVAVGMMYCSYFVGRASQRNETGAPPVAGRIPQPAPPVEERAA